MAALSVSAAPEHLPTTALPPKEDPGLLHVHGLEANAADGLLYAATHFGLWRLPEGGGPERVGEAFHDLMGFTVVGPHDFQASGHAILTEDLPPLLRLIESTDGGLTWQSVSRMGAADFHALGVAHGQVYGWNSSAATLMASDDGTKWEQRSTITIIDFAFDPADADVVLASLSETFDDARLTRRSDGGRTWVEEEGPAISHLAWGAPERLWGFGLDGAVWRSGDRGNSWEQTGALEGRRDALLEHDGTLYAGAGGVILE